MGGEQRKESQRLDDEPERRRVADPSAMDGARPILLACQLRRRDQWQLPEPESVKVCPGIGRNSQLYPVGESVIFRMP